MKTDHQTTLAWSRGAWTILLLLSLCLAVQSASPADPPVAHPALSKKDTPPLKDTWEAAFLDGVHVGHVHRLFREIHVNSNLLVESSVEMDLAFRRHRQPVRWHSIHATHETPSGRLLTFILQEGVGTQQRLYRKGRVEDQKLIWTTQMGQRPTTEKQLALKESVLGLYAQEVLLAHRARSLKQVQIHRFEPVFDSVLPVQIKILESETTMLLDGQKPSLLKTEWRTLGVAEQDAPPEWIWVNEEGECVKRQTRLPLLGELTCYRTTEQRAKSGLASAKLDIGQSSLFQLDRPLPTARQLKSATYRATLIGFEDVVKAFPSDGFQEVRKVGEQQVEIRVQGWRKPEAAPVFGRKDPSQPPLEYLKSNEWITSQDARVQQLARLASGTEIDLWQKAVRIERWVHQNMKSFQTTEGFATASEAAQTLAGDCKGHAVLAAAMCRASGVPSRIVIGLVYVPREKAMGFHMWLEVWIDGHWFALDPTQGLGGVGADHIKVIDHHLNDQGSFTPMLHVARLAGKMQLEVLSSGLEGR